jgi:hypothetical protein
LDESYGDKMKVADKETQIRLIKGMLYRRLRAKGHDMANFSDHYFDEKAEEIYLANPDGIKQLEDGSGEDKPNE